MEHQGVSQIPEAKRLAGEIADAHPDDTTKSSVFEFVRLSQVGKHEVAHPSQSFRLEVEDL